jgi:RecB family exonuclease
VRDYLGDVDPAAEPVGVERTVSAPTSALVLSGRVDRIDERPDGSVVVVDYKTGRHPPADDDARASLALGVYAVAAARTLRRRCAVVELHHLPTGTVAAASHGAEGLARKVSEAESIAREARAADEAYAAGVTGDEEFPARPSSMCSWCDFRPVCAPGRAAAPPRRPWDAVDGSDEG